MKYLLICIFLIGFSNNTKASNVSFKFYGTNLSVDVRKQGFPSIEHFDEISIENAVLELEKNQIFDVSIKNCLELKDKLRLNDWGYFVMINEMAKAYTNQFNHPSNISPLIMAYICSKSGYNVKIGILSEEQIDLFYRTDYILDNVPYAAFDGKVFFIFQRRGEKKKIERITKLASVGRGEKVLDFRIQSPPLLEKNMVEGNRHVSSNNPEWDFSLSINKNLIDFYNDCPIYGKDGHLMTKSIICAEVPFSEEVKEQLYPQMKKLMTGHDQLENVNSLLNWIQFSFDYKPNQESRGYDRPLFPEEMLYYHYSDSEDRSNLFARLIIDLFGLKTAYLYSITANHAAIGINFTDNEAKGDYVVCNGEKYYVCDPTYYNAPVGKKMSSWEAQKVYLFKNKSNPVIAQSEATKQKLTNQLSALDFSNKGKELYDQKEYAKAAEWFKKSAHQGNVYAQICLGVMYEKGQGVPQNYSWAAEWYERAANHGSAAAKKSLARVQEFLSKEKQKQDQKNSSEQNNAIKKQANSIDRKNSVIPDVDKDIPLTTLKNPNLLAVIIGNENYRKLPDVPYAENDAKMFKEYCEKTLGVTKEHIRYLPNAGLVDIYDARDWLKTGAESYGNDASVIFYYAGHGLPNRETGLPYILPVEVDGSNLKLAVSLQELYDEFGKLPARSVTVFLDACFTGVDRDNNVVASREGERLAFKMSPKIPTPTGKTVIFSATENNQTAHPFKDRKHGFFTYFLLRKLQESKGDATLGEIADFVSNGVRRAVFDKIQTSQTPSVKPSGNFANDWRQMKLK